MSDTESSVIEYPPATSPDAENVTDEPQRERMNYELLEALRRGDEEVVRTFFSQDNADEAGRRSWRGVTVGGNSALHIVAGCGHVELAKFICDIDGSLLGVSNAAGETPLHCAVRAGADQIVSHFISVLAADSRPLDEVLPATALYVAAEEGRAAAARELMSALPRLAAEGDRIGISPLYVAVLSGSLEVVQILTEYPYTRYDGTSGRTALHAATMIRNPGS